jgi:hypothetical protein
MIVRLWQTNRKLSLTVNNSVKNNLRKPLAGDGVIKDGSILKSRRFST